ncbi:hypothetical protein J7L01_06725 [bacterium]|nr:hypothetical protein [bacterium]
MKTIKNEIRYHIDIPGIAPKRLPINILVELAELTQKVLRALATEIVQPDFKRGRRYPREIEKLIQLDLIGFEDGSATPVFGLSEIANQPPDENLLISMESEDNIQDKVINDFKEDIELLNNGSDEWKTKVPRRALIFIRDILRIPSKIGTSAFDIAVGDGDKQREWIAIKKDAYKKIEEKLEEKEDKDIVCLGIIREIDEKDRTAELHDPSGTVIKVIFDEELFEDIDAARWKPVHIVGVGKEDKRSRLVKEIKAKKVIPQDRDQEIFWSKDIIEDSDQPSGIVDYDAIEPFSEEFDFEGFMKAIEEA